MAKHQGPKDIKRPIWISVTESAKLMGVQDKTIRRAIKQVSCLKYRIVKDRYQIEIGSLLTFASDKIKLRNKFEQSGIGQYLGPLPMIPEDKKTAPDS
jgi:hypothetical protein